MTPNSLTIRLRVASLQDQNGHRLPTAALTEAAADTIERLRASLKEMVETQDEWERAVEKIIGRAPGVFERAIDRAKKVLGETE